PGWENQRVELRVDSGERVVGLQSGRTNTWQWLWIMGGATALIYLLVAAAFPLISYYSIFIPGAQRVKPVFSLMDRNVIPLDKSAYVAVILLLHVLYLGALAIVLRRAYSSGWASASSASNGNIGRMLLIAGIAC